MNKGTDNLKPNIFSRITGISWKGYQSASLRNIVKMAGVTTGAFMATTIKAKEELFEALVGKHYNFYWIAFARRKKNLQKYPEEQPDKLTSTSGECMYEILLYAYDHLNECKWLSFTIRKELVLSRLMLMKWWRSKQRDAWLFRGGLKNLGRPSPHIDEQLEHILITGMFNTFFELIIRNATGKKQNTIWKQWNLLYCWMDKLMGQ